LVELAGTRKGLIRHSVEESMELRLDSDLQRG
jgi:hypothetical protein